MNLPALPHGWSVVAVDAKRQFVLTKRSRQQPVVLRWEPPFLKATDLQGNPLHGLVVAIPDDVRGPLIEVAKARWGSGLKNVGA